MGPPRRGRAGYRHPLVFLLGLEGLALLRAYAGDGFDREFVDARMAEIRALLDQAAQSLGDGVELGRAGAAEGYREWSATYDEPGNLAAARAWSPSAVGCRPPWGVPPAVVILPVVVTRCRVWCWHRWPGEENRFDPGRRVTDRGL
jgi:hypothetical protein